MKEHFIYFFSQVVTRLRPVAHNDTLMTFYSARGAGGDEPMSADVNRAERPRQNSRFCSRTAASIVFIAAVSLLHIASVAEVRGQDFPYVAPSAPEFDGRGHLVPGAAKPSQSLSANAPSKMPSQPPVRIDAPDPLNGSSHTQNASTRPVVAPRAPGYGVSQDPTPRPSRQASVSQTPDYQDAMRNTSPSRVNSPQPQSQPVQRQDCSQFPMLIAGCRSETEMQMTARRYLTCLIQNGWNMDQARQHVISTIESTYRLAR